MAKNKARPSKDGLQGGSELLLVGQGRSWSGKEVRERDLGIHGEEHSGRRSSRCKGPEVG